LIKIKSDAAVVIFLALSALTNNNIGLKNIAPPIPTIPDINHKPHNFVELFPRLKEK